MISESQTHRFFDRNLLINWVAANAIGLPIAAGIGGATTALIIFIVGEFVREVPSEMGAMVRLGLTILAIFLAGLLGVLGGGSVLMLACGAGGRLIGETLGYPLLGPPMLGSLVLAVAGAVIGLGHWVVLRRHLHRSPGWVLTNIAGWAVAGLVPGLVVNSGDTVSFLNPFYETVASLGVYGSLFSFGLVVGAVGGGVSGVLQWFILRWNGYRVRWWIRASLGGWALGGAIATIVVGGAGVLLGGMIAGGITGVPLAWWLRQPPPET
jgi:hypothetical protein